MLVAPTSPCSSGAKPFSRMSPSFGEGYRWPDRRQRLRQIDLHEDHRRRLEPSAGNISKDAHERMAFLRQDQFAYEDQRVIDVVMMGHQEMWACMQEKDAIYEPGGDRGRLPARRRARTTSPNYGGYTAEARAGELLLGVGIPSEQHYGPMSEVAPGWKLRVLLTQALFADPTSCCSTNRPTTSTSRPSAGWKTPNDRNSTMIIISATTATS